MFGGKINKPVVYTEYVNMRPFLSEPQVFLPPLSACLSSVIILTTPPLRTLPHIILFHPSLSLSLTFPLPTLSSSLSSFSPLLLPPSLSLSLPHKGSVRVVPAIWCTGPLWLLLSLWSLLLLHQKLHGRVVLHE